MEGLEWTCSCLGSPIYDLDLIRKSESERGVGVESAADPKAEFAEATVGERTRFTIDKLRFGKSGYEMCAQAGRTRQTGFAGRKN